MKTRLKIASTAALFLQILALPGGSAAQSFDFAAVENQLWADQPAELNVICLENRGMIQPAEGAIDRDIAASDIRVTAPDLRNPVAAADCGKASARTNPRSFRRVNRDGAPMVPEALAAQKTRSDMQLIQELIMISEGKTIEADVGRIFRGTPTTHEANSAGMSEWGIKPSAMWGRMDLGGAVTVHFNVVVRPTYAGVAPFVRRILLRLEIRQ
jgi:hypothetical protein